MFDENLYQETISALHASEDTLSEVMNMTHRPAIICQAEISFGIQGV